MSAESCTPPSGETSRSAAGRNAGNHPRGSSGRPARRLSAKERRNVIFLGLSGRGKTHMATGLGIEACKNKFRTRFVTCYGLVNELIEAWQEGVLQRLLQRYARYDLLILDELGYIPFSKEGSELLFQVLAERHERGSVMITTNLGFADWTQVFSDPVIQNFLTVVNSTYNLG
ncbi:MAG: ATP-binding protein [Pseudomonadota bacterium]|nr:ATP-binding protein [Pseudomonadota bacterium]